MLRESKNIIKMEMINEFEKELDFLFNEYSDNKFSSNKFIEYTKMLIVVWDLCRLDLKNRGNKNNNIIILKDNKLKINYPDWFKNDEGKGCQIISSSQNIQVSFKSNNNGKLDITLRGPNYHNVSKKRVPVYINCINLILNKNEIITSDKIICHDDPYIYKINYNEGEIIDLNIAFETIHTYFPLLKTYLSDINEENIFSVYKKVKKYISYEKILIKLNDIETDIYNEMISL